MARQGYASPMPLAVAPQQDTVQANLPLSVAVQLGTGFVAAIARDLGVRALVIKGVVATRQGFRPALHSSDVDVLVAPADAERVMATLRSYGWRVRPTAFAPRQFELHSETFFHESWPCDIDVHWRYPGFFADPDVAFETLWDASVELDVAGRTVRVTDEIGSALVLSVHALRDPGRTRSDLDLDAVRSRLAEPAFAERYRSTAAGLRSGYPLRHLLAEAGLEPLLDELPAAERRAWELEVESSGSTSLHWFVAYSEARWYRKPIVVVSLLYAVMRSSVLSRIRLPAGVRRASIYSRARAAAQEIGQFRRARADRTSAGRP
jgi:hypothetical protein